MNGLVQHKADIEIKVLAPTLKILLKDNLGIMNDVLKKGGCDTISHFDCQMCVEVTAKNTTDLLIGFLSDILSLTYMQKSLFCNVYFTELSENRIKAKLYGKWLGEFDKNIKEVIYQDGYVLRNEKNMWESHIIFTI
ncbi:MAG: archease [Flagellimonas sp.]